MNMDVQRIRGDEAVGLADQWLELSADDTLALRIAADESDPALSFFMRDTLIGMLGFIPTGIITGTVYVWMQWAPAQAKYKTSMVRISHYIIPEVLKKYPRIIGHCSFGTSSENWLKSIGAKFEETNAKAKFFTIGAV